jgi:TRAP-type C4-dicarboxylate transport system substrate-binding protein
MPGKKLVWGVAALAFAAAIPVAAQTFTVRLGTLVPDNSPWTNALRAMGPAWMNATNKRVNLRVIPAAAQSEREILTKIPLGSLDAATLMIAGLGSIDESVNVFGIPFFFESDAELQHVQKQLTPIIAQRFEAKRYRLINWGNGGWVRLFSKSELRTVAQIKSAKLYTTEGDQKTVNWYQSNGFNAVPLATAQIKTQLMLPTGSINAAPSPPVYAAALQIYRDAPFMLDVPLGALTAATVMHERAWSRISPEDRIKILEAAAATEKSINAAAPGLDARYEMKKAGLKVVSLTAKELAEFKTTADKLAQSQRGTLVPADIFDAAVRERDAFRKMKKQP